MRQHLRLLRQVPNPWVPWALALLTVTGLALFCCSGCSPDPTKLPFNVAVRKVTALRLEDRDPIEVTDARAVGLLKECLLKAKEVAQPGERTRAARSVTLRFGSKWMVEPCRFVYNDLPTGSPSYVQWGGKWYEVSGDFGPMLDAVTVHRPDSYDVDPADAEFLDDYGWTPFFLISTTNVELPATLIHRPGDFPEVIYWAWNNELNKDVGLDLSPYLGKTVEARLYKTVKMLPEIVGTNRDDGRVVVVRSEGKIVGAWLSLGRHFCFACSLKGRTLKEVTGKTFDNWVTRLIDPGDPTEEKLSAMSPEEILETYYSAIDRKDYATAHACESRSYLVSYLASNMDNDRLYNDGFGDEDGRDLGNYVSVRLLGVMRAEEFERAEAGYGGMRCYTVSVEQHRRVAAGRPDGRSGYFVSMKQETPATGWRINGIGTGP